MPFCQILSNFIHLLPSDLGRAANGLAEIAGGFPIALERALVLERPAAPGMPGGLGKSNPSRKILGFLGWGDNQCEEYLNGVEVV